MKSFPRVVQNKLVNILYMLSGAFGLVKDSLDLTPLLSKLVVDSLSESQRSNLFASN